MKGSYKQEMNFHIYRTNDMLNGDGLRVVLFLSGCSHHCPSCHNPETWNPNSGREFTKEIKDEMYAELEKDWIKGITFSGGDPLHYNNRHEVAEMIKEINDRFPDKDIWVYTGYEFEELVNLSYSTKDIEVILNGADVIVDGKFIEKLKDVKYPWAGSTNQRVIRLAK